MRWDARKLREHYDRHPQVEPCWKEALGHDISIDEYKEESLRTAGPRAKVEYVSTRILVDIEAYEEPETIHFIDGRNFTTVIDESSRRIKTHYHFHAGGRRAHHVAGSIKYSLERNLNDLLADLEAKTRSGFLCSLKFNRFATSVPIEFQQAFEALEK